PTRRRGSARVVRQRLNRTATGVVLLLVYALASVATMRITGHHIRPLFEGVGPPPPYQWVDPPAEFAQSNVKPGPSQTDLKLSAPGSAQGGAGSVDSQLLLSFPQNAIAPKPPNTAVTVSFTPMSPKDVGKLPDGLVADGNVYRVQFTYQPSKTPV